MAKSSAGLTLEIDGLSETLKSVRAIADAHERKTANAQLRGAANECAQGLAVMLAQSAESCGVPVAPRVARSIKVKRDRVPVVTVGGPMRVGRGGDRAPAARLVWGSEQGPKGEPNHFAVPPSSGYWIAPAVKRFGEGPAVPIYKRAVVDIYREHGLV